MGRTADLGLAGQWRARLERFRRAGLTVSRFCAAERVSVASFYGWRRKLAGGSAGAKRRPAAGDASFQAVELVSGLPEVLVSIRLAAGATIEVSGSGDLVERLYAAALERLGGSPACGGAGRC